MPVIDIQWPRLGLDLLLDLAAEAVGVAEAQLDVQSLWRQRTVDMGFAGQRRGAGGLPLGGVGGVGLQRAPEAVEVVDDAGGGVPQQRGCGGARVGCIEEAAELGLREVGDEAAERVAFHRRWQRLAHHGRAHHHAEGVEGHFGLVAVRVADQTWLEYPVVVGIHRDAVAERVAGFRHQQVMRIEVDEGVLAERVAVAARQEEVAAGRVEFGLWAVDRAVAEEAAAGRQPPATIAVQVDIAAAAGPLAIARIDGQNLDRRGDQRRAVSLVDLSDQPRREGQLVALAGQAERLKSAQRQEGGQVIAAVQRAKPFNGAAALAAGSRGFIGDFRGGELVPQATCVGGVRLDKIRRSELAC